MPHYPSVYPSEVKYRPGRIQSLNAQQEVILKQCWATLLRYWGYEIDLSVEDIQNREAYVASSVCQDLAATNDSASIDVKKKKSFFSKKNLQHQTKGKLSEKRGNDLRKNSQRYTPNVTPSRDVIANYYKHVGHESCGESDIDDDASLDTFQTASDSLEGTLVDFAAQEATKLQSATNATYRKRGSVDSQNDLLLFMSEYDPSEIHNCFLGTIKNDLIDNFVLRFVRARKGNYDDTMKMLIKSIHWRHHEVEVENLLREGDAPSVVTGEHPGFVKNFMVNKAFVRGEDKNKNPLFIFQSRKHFASDSSLAGTERYALLIIEWCRLFLREVNESVDLCSLMFDLSGFSMKNADNAPVKFLTSIFEAHYPESLGIVIVHNAPWIFSTVWNIIKNWLDPVVASKIHFTKSYEDLQKFIEPKYIPEYLGGKDVKELTYHKPGPEHTKPMKEKDKAFYSLKRERDQILLQIIETTKRWICCTDSEASSFFLKEKIVLSYQLSNNYIALDPYLRNPGVYDRDGTLKLRN